MKRILRKSTVVFFSALFAGGLFSTIYFDEHFYQTRPRQPEPQSGRIYLRIIHHGERVYLTQRETLPFDYGMLCAIPFFIAVLLELRWKTFRNPYDNMPKKLY